MRFKQFILAEQNKLNVATTSLEKGKEYAEQRFEAAGKDLYEEIPKFDKNYMMLQKIYKKHALGIKRIDMPVIEPSDMVEFDRKLKAGYIDIFKPYAKIKDFFPKGFDGEIPPGEWLSLGKKDGKEKDDIIKGKWTKIKGSNLKPIQDQVWLEKIIGNILKFGMPTPGSRVTETTIIVSKEGYILDGHHRHGQVMIANPNLKMKALWLPLDVKLLLKMGKSYGEAIGNKGKA